MTNVSASEIVESYRTALGKGDFALARNLMQDNMIFEGPLDTFNKADDYLAANKKLSSIIQRVDLKKVFFDGNDVCVLYDWLPIPPPERLSSRNGIRSRVVRSHTFALYSMHDLLRPCSEGEG